MWSQPKQEKLILTCIDWNLEIRCSRWLSPVDHLRAVWLRTARGGASTGSSVSRRILCHLCSALSCAPNVHPFPGTWLFGWCGGAHAVPQHLPSQNCSGFTFTLHTLMGKKDCTERCSAVRGGEQIRSYSFSNFSDSFINWYLSASDPSDSLIYVILKALGTIYSCRSVLLDSHTLYKWLCLSKNLWVAIFCSIFCYRNTTLDLGSS